jgi:cyclic pyranopterin phosphate synthase
MAEDDALTHLDAQGRARMVEVGDKAETRRTAVAVGAVAMQPSTLARLLDGDTPKGDVLATARIAGIQAAKKTSELIPLCHPIRLTSIEITFEPDVDASVLHLRATAQAFDRTGVEMEALSAASVAALTVYDMLKAVDRGMKLSVSLASKSGGRSGDWSARG